MKTFSSYKIILIFYLLCFVHIGKIHSQLSVKEHTKFHIDTNFTSFESYNVINSDVKGKGQLVFNSAHAQELNTAHFISLPNITINTSSSFTFNTAIQIVGDLSLNSKLVNIHSPIYMEGKLQVADQTKIFGKENIQFQTQLQPQSFPLSNQHQTTNITLDVEHIKHINTPANQNFKKTKYFHKNCSYLLLAIEIPTPPPEIPLIPKGGIFEIYYL